MNSLLKERHLIANHLQLLLHLFIPLPVDPLPALLIIQRNLCRLVRQIAGLYTFAILPGYVHLAHMNHRTTRDKLLSYLSAEARRQRSCTFTVPFNRQQLADYLGVQRAAMCAELSRMQKDGLIEYHRNRFTFLTVDQLL